MSVMSTVIDENLPMAAPALGITHQLRISEAQDADEHAQNLTDWEQSYDQITPGRFQGSLWELQLPGAQVFRERISHAVRQSCCVRPKALWFGLADQAADTRINGRVAGAGQIMVRPGHREFELVTPSDHTIYGVVIQRIVAKARDYVLAHRDQAVTVPQLCEHLFVSRRTLQYCFEDVLNLSPIQYLRLIRLNGARRSLRGLSGTPASVRDVATTWGFWHFSQFSSDYRKLFGQCPSESLARRAH